MFLFLYKSSRMILTAIRGSHSPEQIAFGIALGMVIGLIPKDSLFAFSFGFLIFATSVNLLATSVSAFTFSWIGVLLDPVSHVVGRLILAYPGLQTTWLWLHELPIIPWTRFNNTVVMGSLVIGLLSMLPLYLVSKDLCIRLAPGLQAFLLRFWLYRKLAGRQELAGAEE